MGAKLRLAVAFSFSDTWHSGFPHRFNHSCIAHACQHARSRSAAKSAIGRDRGLSTPASETGIGPSTPNEESSEVLPSVPGYELLAILGRGGMGVVYKALDTRLNRIVALKMLLGGEHAGADRMARFRREAETVARLQHPNIVQIYEVGDHTGVPYCALEYVARTHAGEWMNGRSIRPRDARAGRNAGPRPVGTGQSSARRSPGMSCWLG